MKVKSNSGLKLLTMGIIITAVCFLWAGASVAAGLESKLVVVTSYPKDLTGPFKKAFEA